MVPERHSNEVAVNVASGESPSPFNFVGPDNSTTALEIAEVKAKWCCLYPSVNKVRITADLPPNKCFFTIV